MRFSGVPGPRRQRGFAWLPAAISGAASLFGGARANRASSAQALRQMQFQERMSSTAHQREVADLRKAGLNPILSGTGGSGASSPGGAQAPQKDIFTPAVSSALQTRRLSQELKNMEATEGVSLSQTELNNARTVQTAQQSRVLGGPAQVGDWLSRIGEFVNQDARPAVRSAYNKLRALATDLFERIGATSSRSLEAVRTGSGDRLRNPDGSLNVVIRRGRGE